MDNIKIFFIDKRKWINNVNPDSLKYFLENRTFKSQKRLEEFCLGRFLLKYVLKNYYNINTPQITIENNKPKLESNKIFFSISHSKDIVLVALFNKNIGVDVEQLKDRDYARLFEYYKIKPKKINKISFYKFWTEYEAKIKLQDNAKSICTMKFLNDYMLSLAISDSSCGDISKMLNIYELISPNDNINPKELINLKLVIESKKNENTVVAQEISTAQFDFILNEEDSLTKLNLNIE